MLLIEDGHGSHITLDVIELARKNDIHLLCLPYHTSHILQPLDIGVFKSFKSGYSKACRKYIMENPGRVITSEVIASLVGETWAHSITPMNILSGFKKSGISPLNPSEVSDRMLTPAAIFKPSSDASSSSSLTPPTASSSSLTPPTASSSPLTPPTFSDEQSALYEKRLREGYNVHDPQYELWVKVNHPGSSDADSMKTHISKSVSTVSSDDLGEILKYPEAKVTSKLKKLEVNSTSAVCLSDSPVVWQLKEKEQQKRHSAEEKARKREEREKKKERKKLLKKKEKEEKRKEREIKRGQKGKEKTGTRMPSRRNKKPPADVSDQDEEEGGMVKEVRRRTEKRCRMTREMLNALCAIYMDCLVNGFVATIGMYGTTLIALMQILIEFQISFTVFSVCKFFSSFFRFFFGCLIIHVLTHTLKCDCVQLKMNSKCNFTSI